MQFFYQPEVTNNQHFLEDEEYQHCVKVLRNKPGDKIGILDGKGAVVKAVISELTGKRCNFEIMEQEILPPKGFINHIAISPTKNSDRMEWFVEKACELGVNKISLVLTRNSERKKLRTDRLIKKSISALKQSRSGYLTEIEELQPFQAFIRQCSMDIKTIAVVEDGLSYLTEVVSPMSDSVILIGPEGDFDPTETEQAVHSGFQKVSLGKNTLRTETAGIIAAEMVNVVNRY